MLKVTFYLIKTDNRTNKISNSSNTIALSKGTIFAKNDDFLQRKMLISAKLRGTSYLKVSFLKLHMCVYLPSKFQVPSIILTSFIQGVALIRSHIFRNIFLMIWKDWSFCGQNLQYLAILHKRLKTFIFIFFYFNFSFF